MQRASSRRTGASGEKDGFRPDIEGLRGVAVLLVVFFHAGLLSTAGTQLPGGFIGVDLFFVISGFLITGLLIRERERNGRIGFARFYARRVRRILPAAAVCLLITIPLAYYLVTLIERPPTMQDGASAALSFANVRFALTTDYFHPVSYSPFLHFWSLGVEEQFYFVWPALLAVVAWRSTRLGAGIALAAIVVGSFLLSLAWTQDNPTWAFYMLPTRAWQLAAGGLLAVGAGSLKWLPGPFKSVVSQLLVDRRLAGSGRPPDRCLRPRLGRRALPGHGRARAHGGRGAADRLRHRAPRSGRAARACCRSASSARSATRSTSGTGRC